MMGRLGHVFARVGDRLRAWQIGGPLFRKYVALFLAVVCVALSYAGGPPGVIARYARGGDYHTVIKSKLARLASKVSRRC